MFFELRRARQKDKYNAYDKNTFHDKITLMIMMIQDKIRKKHFS